MNIIRTVPGGLIFYHNPLPKFFAWLRQSLLSNRIKEIKQAVCLHTVLHRSHVHNLCDLPILRGRGWAGNEICQVPGLSFHHNIAGPMEQMLSNWLSYYWRVVLEQIIYSTILMLAVNLPCAVHKECLRWMKKTCKKKYS